ncbi:hypothetical protein ND861_07295 [Leptospira sp. 2 VSF19]|uniref:Uncharacterized protein n=1 Tax=Leptospira soteropolitanensis TaxID=2950025 RepID=A0AAW5VDR1_9LEPT|nr:hypothetical protein [Leptospira soteropolitanensis]MCW7492800.1 hypothetical protein [Leptospira soteropolitanensis]MCW7500035.1 hypothetical protein [Leptospira soteropolitanensis]MCW7522286.1 hypothetical protein [Leptospira soteropolitanensis]MCW7526142.1 hypothetical protein [Leptospira soteropolitanensis]MCW7529746.1 hypothetical protein [Leptospira soteropolitanensis]
MNLELNPQETKHLLNALAVFEWVSNSPHEETDPSVDEFIQSILKKLSVEKESPIVSENGLYTISEEYFQEVFESYLEPYNDDIFWTDLSTELAQRDLELKVSAKDLEALSPEDYETKVAKEAEKYDTEFEKNGVDNLFLKK